MELRRVQLRVERKDILAHLPETRREVSTIRGHRRQGSKYTSSEARSPSARSNRSLAGSKLLRALIAQLAPHTESRWVLGSSEGAQGSDKIPAGESVSILLTRVVARPSFKVFAGCVEEE